jgi:N,N-dimethylformamidase beta subunit-like protein
VRLLGYSDRLSVAPGGTIRFMVSCDHPEYDSRLVRLIHGDENPSGPGFKQVEVPSAIDGRRPGRHQAIHGGSYVEVPLPTGAVGPSLGFSVYLYPTNPRAGEQVIASVGDPYAGSGWAVALSPAGAVELVVPGARISTGAIVNRWTWYRIECVVAGDRATIRQAPLRTWPGDASAGEASRPLALPPLDGPLILGAVRSVDGMTRHLDGKLDAPVLDGVGAWDFSSDIASDRVTDRSGSDRHGWTVNMPTRGVTGHAFDGGETNVHLAPDQYGGMHFHRDDLEDVGWEIDFELKVPDDLGSGVYAIHLRSDDDEDHLPFVVRPPRGIARSSVAMLMPTLTYVVYANFTDLGPGAWREGATGSWSSATPHADPTLLRDVYRYIDENALYGLYDLHVDGSGVCYGSHLRPILNMRPKFRYRIWAAPPRFPADLYLIDWLDHYGIDVDVISDHDLHAEGSALLEPYSVVLSGTHPEYWTSRMLDGLGEYLGDGGRFMYLGGNGLFGVASFHPEKPHVVEVRRWGAPWPFEVPPAERRHSTTGEPGGTWRNRGRPPNGMVGVGTSGAGFDRAVPYRRMPGGRDPRVRFIFDGLESDQRIGDQPNLQTRWGAAGYEIDRFDPELGSPASTLLLASSVGFTDAYRPMVDEVLWFVQGRDGRHPDDPQVDGEPHRFVRSDMVYLEYPNGGAVFSVGSIAWCGAISHNGYDNPVSRLTSNVLRRFADRPKGESPSDPAG